MRSFAVLAAAVVGGCAQAGAPTRTIVGADAGRGLDAMAAAGCAACHAIPGIAWPQGAVGPSLADFGARTLIAGRFPNQPDHLVRWLRDAPSMAPQTAMPASDISDAQARDMAAYLYSLDGR